MSNLIIGTTRTLIYFDIIISMLVLGLLGMSMGDVFGAIIGVGIALCVVSPMYAVALAIFDIRDELMELNDTVHKE